MISVKFILFNKLFIESFFVAHIVLYPRDAVMDEEVSVLLSWSLYSSSGNIDGIIPIKISDIGLTKGLDRD